MATIGTLAARILADASGIKSGLGLTRNELKLTRDVFMATRTDAEKLNQTLAILDAAKAKGAYKSEEDYARAVAYVRAEYDAATPAGQAMARAAKEAKDAFAASRPPLQQYVASITPLIAALRSGAITTEEFKARQQQLAQILPEVQAKAQAEAAALKDAAAKQAAAQAEVNRVVSAAKAAYDQARSPGAKYREEISKLIAAYRSGSITQQEFLARKRQMAQVLPEVTAKTKAQKEAQDAANKSAAEGKRIAEGLRSSTQVHRDRMAELTSALRGGHITQQQFVKGSREASAEWWSQVPLVGGLGSKIAGLGPAGIAASAGIAVATAAFSAAVAAAAFFGNAVRQQFTVFDELAAKAGKVGVSTAQMWALARGAERGRVPLEALSNAMVELQKRLVETKPTSDASRAALESMKQAAPTEQLMRTLDALRNIQNPTERAAATMKAFGDAGKEILPILRMNNQEYSAWRDQLTGELRNPIDAASIDAANAAMRDVRLQFERVAAVAASKLAPWIQVVAEKMKAWLDNKEVMAWMSAAMQDVGIIIGAVGGIVVQLGWEFQNVVTKVLLADAAASKFMQGVYKAREMWNKLTGDIEEANAMKAAADQAGQAAAASMDEVNKRNAEYAAAGGALAGAKWAYNFSAEATAASGSPTSSQQTQDPAIAAAAQKAAELQGNIEELTTRLREQAATVGMSSDQAEIWKLQQQGATDAALSEVRALQQQSAALERQEELRKNVGALTDRLREQIATFGMSSDQIEIWKLRQQGATQAELQTVQVMQIHKAALDDQKKAMDEGKQLADQYATPQEKLAKRMQDLARLYRVGAIDLRTYQRAQEAELATFRDAARQKQAIASGPNTAIRKGSAEDAAETAQKARDALAARDAFRAEKEVARSVAMATGAPAGTVPANGRVAATGPAEPTRVSVETDRKTEQFQRLTVGYLAQLVRLSGGSTSSSVTVEMM